MSNNKHPFVRVSELVDNYSENKNSFDSKQLQDLRENISLTLFYLSDSASEALARYERAEHERKMKMAEREQHHRSSSEDGVKAMTVSEAQNLARIDCREEVNQSKEALRQKERVKIILSATQQILNSISSRLHMIQK